MQHLSEVAIILKSALAGDLVRVQAYAGLLAFKLTEDGEERQASIVRNILAGIEEPTISVYASTDRGVKRPLPEVMQQTMSDLSDNNPPYHTINVGTGKHCGPFSSYLDAALALSINTDGGWCHGRILNKDEFDAHLAQVSG